MTTRGDAARWTEPAPWGLPRLAVATIAVTAVSVTALYSAAAYGADSRRAAWVATGGALGILLQLPRRQQYAGIAVFFVIAFGSGFVTGPGPGGAPSFAVVHTAMVAVGVLALRGDRGWVDGTRESLSGWLRFAVCAVVVIPAAAAVVSTVVPVFGWELPVAAFWSDALGRWVTFALSIVVFTPLVLRLRPSYLRRWAVTHAGGPAELVGLGTLVAVVGLLAMLQPNVVVAFALSIPVVLLVVRAGLVGAVVGIAVATACVLLSTRLGFGPFIIEAAGHVEQEDVPSHALLIAQCFVLQLAVMGYAWAALLAERSRAGRQRNVTDEVYRLIADASESPIAVLDGRASIIYGSPSTGPVPRLAVGHSMYAVYRAHVHPADENAFEESFAAVLAGSDTATAHYQRRDGDEWRWIQLRLRVARRADDPSETRIVAFAHDVTESMTRHGELVREGMELAVAAGTDPLTGLPNRRRLAEVRADSWATAVRTGRDLAMLIIDIDRFKSYNDHYGHDAGDDCLVSVGHAIASTLRRSGDVVARYGGEEFVAVLPGTGIAGARHVGEAVRLAVREQGITHDRSPAGIVTVSVGVAAIGRTVEDDAALFGAADAALYRAKSRGRDRVEAAQPHP